MHDSDRVSLIDTPCPRCGEPLQVEEKAIMVADQSEPVCWAIQGLGWCWNGCQ